MRVLHVTDTYLPTFGGIELHLRDLVAHQQEEGHEAHVSTATPLGDGVVSDPPWVHRATTGGARPTLRQALLDVRRHLAEVRPDVVHVHVSVFSPYAALGLRRTVALELPTLVTLHSMWQGLGPWPDLARRAMATSRDPVVWSAVSQAAAKPLSRVLGGASVRVLPNAVDLTEWTPPTASAVGAPTVLAVMRMTRVKRTLPLMRVLGRLHAEVPAARAVVVGEGPQRPAALRYLGRQGLDDVVDLPGRLPRHQVRERMLGAVAFVAPARRESFGIAALEARAMGLPVVGFRESGLSQFVTSGREGLLAEDDDELTAHLVALLTDPGLRGRIASYNRTHPPRHDWVDHCARTTALYGEAMRAVAQRHGAVTAGRRR